MNNKVVFMNPDGPYAAIPSTADEIAEQLEGMAADLRSGESTIQYGAFVYVNNTSRIAVRTIGEQTCHQQIGMLSIALHQALMDLYNIPEGESK